MEVRGDILLIIAGASLVTVLPRVLPLVLLSRVQLPNWAMRWLSFVPVAVMAALVGQDVLAAEGQLAPPHQNAELIAALPTFAAALLTRSLLVTVVAGVVSMMALRFLM